MGACVTTHAFLLRATQDEFLRYVLSDRSTRRSAAAHVCSVSGALKITHNNRSPCASERNVRAATGPREPGSGSLRPPDRTWDGTWRGLVGRRDWYGLVSRVTVRSRPSCGGSCAYCTVGL